MKHLNDQYYGGNRLKEVGAPIECTDAANKEYVDAATNRPAAGKDIRYEPIVPFDYVQLQYLSNAASTRLDTGFALDCNNIEMEITVEAKTGSWYIFQSRENSNERTNGIAGASSGAKIQFGFSGTTIVSGISRTAGRTYTVIAKAKHGNSSIYVKEHETGEEDYKTGTYTFVPDASNLFLWGNAAGNSVASGNKVLRARLWKNDVIVMDYIPAKTTVNDVEITGFYDRVSQTLKTTVVGSVTAGDVVSPTEKVISVVPNVPTKTSELVNDKGYITESDVPNADWNATSGLAQILNKPGIGKVVRGCHLQQDGRLVEDKINPVRTDEELYLVTFDSNTIPSHWIVCDGDVVVDYTAPNVALSMFQKDDVCLFLGKYKTFIDHFTQQEQTSLELQLLLHSRWGSMIATKQDALPSLTNNAGKVLTVNNDETGVEWVNQSGGGTAPKETMRVTCSTDTATQIKDVTIAGYEPKDGDLISVYFSNNVGIRAQLRINSNITCNILSLGTAIDTGIIKAGDTATFSIDRSSSPGKAYLLSIDRASVVAATMPEIPDELNDLSDVSVALPANRRVLIYDSTEQKWVCEKIYYTFNVIYTYNSTTGTFTVTGIYRDGGEPVTYSEIIQQLNTGRPVRCTLSTSDTGSDSRPVPIGFYLYPRDDTNNGVFTNTYYDKMIMLNGNQNDEWYLTSTSIIPNRVKVYSGTAAPSNSLGSNGDIYIQIQS